MKEHQELAQLPDFTNPAIAARAWASEYEQKIEAKKLLEIAQPKADVFTMICEDEGFTLTADQIAKNACQSGLTGTQVRIILRAENILCKNKNEPTAEAVRKGLARLMVEEIDTGWTKKIVSVPKFRGKVIDIVVSSWKKKSGYLL
jgi:phage antirepressor YoqD-like protein